MWLTRSLGVNLHPTSLPGGRLGPEAYAFVDWLAAAGARFWQVLPLNPPDELGSPYASASAFAAWPGLLADPEARGRAVRAAPLRGRERVLDRRLGRRSREATRWPSRCASSASGRRCARTPPSAACGWSATSRSTSPPSSCDHAGPPRALPPRRLRRRRAARSAQRDRPEVGQPALRLGRARARRLPLVDRAPAPDARPRRRLPDRPLPRVRRLLGGAGRRPRRRATATGRRAPARPSSAPPSASSASCP